MVVVAVSVLVDATRGEHARFEEGTPASTLSCGYCLVVVRERKSTRKQTKVPDRLLLLPSSERCLESADMT